MKNKTVSVFVAVLMSVAFTTAVSGQSTKKSAQKTEQKSTKIVKERVPKAVTENFSKEYPMAIRELWYVYPEFDIINDWYYYDPFLFSRAVPEYYIAEFVIDGHDHKVIYSKEGKKIAVHKKGITDLPETVSDAIRKSIYSTYNVAEDKEEIFRDSSLDLLKVYKIEVDKGPSKHYLFFSSEGQLLKDKTTK
ncbi:PepSY-like domain-containing protein [Chryseobacterium ginsenosidimutans]|uniref:PepSY-like domain-containing protein n=1 Tax=Chryseobacterium ginsenosidimutans TaxID=687846 RepID=UPI0027BAB4BD|nr:PepSY-like domain-containing protein [Chryseobacterium ginsenosidimutans]